MCWRLAYSARRGDAHHAPVHAWKVAIQEGALRLFGRCSGGRGRSSGSCLVFGLGLGLTGLGVVLGRLALAREGGGLGGRGDGPGLQVLMFARRPGFRGCRGSLLYGPVPGLLFSEEKTHARSCLETGPRLSGGTTGEKKGNDANVQAKGGKPASGSPCCCRNCLPGHDLVHGSTSPCGGSGPEPEPSCPASRP